MSTIRELCERIQQECNIPARGTIWTLQDKLEIIRELAQEIKNAVEKAPIAYRDKMGFWTIRNEGTYLSYWIDKNATHSGRVIEDEGIEVKFRKKPILTDN